MDEHTFNNNGVILNYYTTGEGKDNIFIQHGFSDSALVWERLAKDLGKKYRTVLMDARGHGYSSKPSSGYDVITMADDIKALILYLELENMVMIGQSMGGCLITRLAARYPELIKGLILIDPPFSNVKKDLGDIEKGIAERIKEIQTFKKIGKERLISHIRSHHPNWEKSIYEPNAQGKLLMSINAVEIIKAIEMWDWKSDLGRIRCPVLLVTGDIEKSAIISGELSTIIKDTFNNVEVVHIVGAGHNIERDMYKDLMDRIEQFLYQL